MKHIHSTGVHTASGTLSASTILLDATYHVKLSSVLVGGAVHICFLLVLQS